MSDEEKTQNGAEAAAEQSGEHASTADAKLKEEMLYLRAEFENTKRRLYREQENAIRFANEKLVGDLLGIVDLFERGLASSRSLHERGSDELKNFVTGIEMTHRELVNMLQRSGVELTGEAGEKFDPSKHEAVSQAPVADSAVDTVVAVVQRGCLFQGRLLKPAKVVVGVAKET
ncbi:nucleotide exchange factor GrpE [bacterium]|nr:nucleotide exchange factor GrpE [bacterium]